MHVKETGLMKDLILQYSWNYRAIVHLEKNPSEITGFHLSSLMKAFNSVIVKFRETNKLFM